MSCYACSTQKDLNTYNVVYILTVSELADSLWAQSLSRKNFVRKISAKGIHSSWYAAKLSFVSKGNLAGKYRIPVPEIEFRFSKIIAALYAFDRFLISNFDCETFSSHKICSRMQILQYSGYWDNKLLSINCIRKKLDWITPFRPFILSNLNICMCMYVTFAILHHWRQPSWFERLKPNFWFHNNFPSMACYKKVFRGLFLFLKCCIFPETSSNIQIITTQRNPASHYFIQDSWKELLRSKGVIVYTAACDWFRGKNSKTYKGILAI